MSRQPYTCHVLALHWPMHIHRERIMASSVVVFVLLKLLLEQCTITSGSTHWIVTEDGRLQSQADSVFNLRRPYDLVAFMRQEERAYMLGNLKKELLSRKSEIDRHEDRDSAAGLEQKFYQTDPDCIEAGKPLPEFDLYISTVLPLENKGIRPEEHVDLNAPLNIPPIAPDCQAVTSLDFSMHAFEHLEGLKDRRNLSGTPELGLKNAITHRENVDEYGHLVYEALNKNTTSWILYNMAAFYWRIKGEPFQAIECIRRALHYSPRHQKDVALISLANILHRARYSNEAAILVHSALDLSRELNVNHFTLGNIYAVLGEYNKSIICFENTLKIQPEFEAAAKRKHAVLCHSKLEAALEAQHRALQKTLKELKDYQKKHDIYQTQNEKLATEQVLTEVKISQRIAYEHSKMKDSSNEMGEYCRMVDRDGKQVLLCTWSRRSADLDFDFAFLDNPPKKENQQEEEENGFRKSFTKDLPDYTKPVRPPRFSKNRPSVPKFQNSEGMMEEWPSKDECDTYVQKVPDPRNLSTVFLSPENKGFEVKTLLTEAQGLIPDVEHPLPWYPPVCVPLMELPEGSENTYDHLKSVSYAERSRIPLKHSDPSMRKTLLEHVNGGSVTEEEVGQRILTAIRQMIGPQWVLYNLAGLYWRVIGNSYHGIECLRRALHLSPPEFRDVPLNNLANILYRWGRIDDALAVMKDAVNISDVEPASNLLYAHLLWASSNHTGAVWHYRHALEIQPDLNEAFSTLRALRCYLKYHQAAQSAAPVETPTTPLAPNCGQKPGGGSMGAGGQADSRVICKTENGEEKCIIETRIHNKAGNCNGQCTQTCTITPIKLDTCTGLGADINLDGLQGGNQCGQKGQQFSPDQEELLFSGDFTGKLDEVSEYYEKKGLCQGEECSQLRVQCLLPMKTHSGLVAHVITPPKLFMRPVALHATHCMQGGQKPHVKLEYVEGVLHRKLIFLNAPGDLHVEPHECVIFNDGARSLGCSRSEFRTYFDNSQMVKDMEAINTLLSQELKTCCQVKMQDSALPQQPTCMKKKSLPFPETSVGKKSEQVGSDEDLPDISIYIVGRYHLQWNKEECRNGDYMNFDFKGVTSTWLPITETGINLSDYIDFGIVVKHNFMEPACNEETSVSATFFDSLPGVSQLQQLQYAPETALRKVLQTLGGEIDPLGVVGTRIAKALNEHPTSWELANLAALYWRVEGNPVNAVNCLRLALANSPSNARSIALISLANILHQAGHLDDAIIVMAAALDVSKEVVIAQFTLANIYAAKEEWTKAAQFYESTLALQPTFQPAKYRLQAILCQGQISQAIPSANPTS
ncbi:tetratricopeptide repeat protein 17-like isoform X2 [Pomacea canaliculata]|uniref:tetratricopeptide repeat protein 17-like isoform X2 n=1 Tax=Pomacea canaliculata TaxID=400727 RepID=UPI000D72E9FD|nr:tetratricopeptide repeat protein 17-like isoform X2 [Pomacea canaliculata]